MAILKKIENGELYLYMNGKLIYKKWLDTGYSKVFDLMAYDKYTLASIHDLEYENPEGFMIVKAKIKLRSTEEGGRKTGFVSGYRPNHVFEYRDDQMLRAYMGDIVFEGQDTIEPGEEKTVTVRFLPSMPIEKYMQIGRKWWVHEGPRSGRSGDD